MKNLALENYGVDTLSLDEMIIIDGGISWHEFWAVGIMVCTILLILL